MNRIFIGIDPGLTGALAVLPENRIPSLFDTPVLNRGKKHDYDVAAMSSLLRQQCQRNDAERVMVAIEKVNAIPSTDGGHRSMGTVSAFRMGYGLGLWIGLLSGLRLPWEFVTPQAWKKALMDGEPKEKDASRAVAMRLFPSAIPHLSRKKDHGRADALLIAEFSRRWQSGVSVTD